MDWWGLLQQLQVWHAWAVGSILPECHLSSAGALQRLLLGMGQHVNSWAGSEMGCGVKPACLAVPGYFYFRKLCSGDCNWTAWKPEENCFTLILKMTSYMYHCSIYYIYIYTYCNIDSILYYIRLVANFLNDYIIYISFIVFLHMCIIFLQIAMVFLCGVAWQAIGAKICGLTNAWSAERTILAGGISEKALRKRCKKQGWCKPGGSK